MPNAQDGHCVRPSDPIDDDIGRHRDQFARIRPAAQPAATGEHCQTVAREKEFSPDVSRRDRIVDCDIADDTADIRQCLGAPNDRQESAGLWRWNFEVAFRDP